MVLKHKTATKPAHEISSSGDNRSIDTAGGQSDSDDTVNYDITIETLMNSTSIPILGGGSDNSSVHGSGACEGLSSMQDKNVSDTVARKT